MPVALSAPRYKTVCQLCQGIWDVLRAQRRAKCCAATWRQAMRDIVAYYNINETKMKTNSCLLIICDVTIASQTITVLNVIYRHVLSDVLHSAYILQLSF